MCQESVKCYKSYFTNGTKEIGIEKPANILKHPIFYAIPLVLGLFLYFLSQSSLLSGDLFGTQAIADSIEEKRQESFVEVDQPDTSDQPDASDQPDTFDQPSDSFSSDQSDSLSDYLVVGIINSKRILKSKIDGSVLVIE